MPMLEGGGIVAGMMNANAMQTDIRGQQLVNEAMAQKIQAQRTAMEMAAQSRAALQKSLLEQAASDSVEPRGPSALSSGGMSPSKLATSEGSDLPGSDAMLAGGGAGMGEDGPKLSDLHLKEYKDALRKAKAVAPFDVAANEKFSKDAEIAIGKATAAKTEERKAALEKWTAIKNMASAAQDEASLNDTVIPMGIAQFGKDFPQFLKQVGLKQDPATGRFVYNDKVIRAVGDSALNEVDRVKRDQRAAEEDRRLKNEQSLEQFRLDSAQHKRAMELIAREGLEASKASRQALEESRKFRDSNRATEQVQRSLDKDPVYSKFTQYQGAMDLAKDAVKVLSTQDGFQNFQASDARALATSFNNISEGFKSRQGGKYAMQDMAAFNGALQRVNKWVESMGRGTPTFSESTARDVANSITQVYDIANKNTVIVSLEAQELAKKKGGDPTQIKVKGDLQRLINTKQARMVQEGGKQYFVVGREGQQQHKFEVDPEEQ